MNRTRITTAEPRPIAGAGLVLALLLASCATGSNPASPETDAAPAVSTAPATARIDLVDPTFSNPTEITNPWFPISSLTQVVRVGMNADGPLREESTRLPGTRVIEWNGQRIETVMSHFLSYSDWRIVETGVNYFAQADDGSVWSFGSEVRAYENGSVIDQEGSWFAGADGPPGMIMPSDPQVGDVYRPENIPDVTFAEVVVQSVDETVDGPLGPISDCLLIEVHPMDGATETKLFAPGYAEFQALTRSDDAALTVSVGLPIDGLDGALPAELETMSTEAQALLRPISNWQATAASIAWLTAGWESYRRVASPLTADQVDRALQALRTGLSTQDSAATHLAATDLAFATTDLRLRYETPAAVDLERMAILAERVILDAADHGAGAVAGDVAALQAIWSRIHLAFPNSGTVDAALDELIDAAEATDLAAAATTAEQLGMALARL